MITQIIFETHSLSEDNGLGVASGWNHSRLSEKGRALAQELGKRRSDDNIQTVFTSDLYRAVETATHAFANTGISILCDWRLRECDYGDLNGMPAVQLHQTRRAHLDQPYPNGESWRQAVRRAGRFLGDLRPRWADSRILVIGHIATKWALDHHLNDVSLEDLMDADFGWREGWEYRT